MPATTDELEVTLTDGAIRNGYLRLPSEAAKHMLSNGFGDLSLEVDGLGTVDGSFDPGRSMFRWRGWKRFYKLHHLGPGDQVVIRRISESALRVSAVRRDLLGGLSSGSTPDPEGNRTAEQQVKRTRVAAKAKRCNELDGATWLQYSVSIWSDIRKTPEEAKLNHPAMLPSMLVDRLIRVFMRPADRVVLARFVGSGSTLLAAREAGKNSIAFELSSDYIALGTRRLDQHELKAIG